MSCNRITYKLHAVEQMFVRNITQEEVEYVISQGETFANYSTDKPYPSVLRMGFADKRPIHLVIAQDNRIECYIVTAYEPNVFLWSTDFKAKKK